MIPKTLHYCWFGEAEKPEIVEKCIASWKKYCPEYTIIEWNENNSPIHENAFAEEAFKEKKWAFVSDYIRLWALFNYGGIYLDTDVELLQPMDTFLKYKGFMGYADDVYINPALFGFEKQNALCGRFLQYYDNRHFVNEDGVYDIIPNNEIYSDICINELGMHIGDDRINLGDVQLFPTRVLAPYKKCILGNDRIQYSHKNYLIKKDTYAIHHATYSWKGKKHIDKGVIVMFVARLVMPSKLVLMIKRNIKYKEIKRKRRN